MDRLVILVPHLHRANAPEWMPQGTRLLDPGVAQEEVDCRYLPVTLPFDPAQARKALAAMKEFVSRFRSPGELASITAALDEQRVHSGMARDEMQALDDFIRGQYTAGERAIPDDEETGRALVSAQLTLLLAWSAEEAFLDVARLSQEYGRTWDRFRLAVGLEESDAEEVLAGVPGRLTGVSPVEFPEPGRELFDSWPQVVESLLAFLPKGSTLYIADERLAAAWKEAGMCFREESGLVGGDPPSGRLLRGAGPGWLLSGRRQAAPGKSWHEEQYQVVYWERVE